LVGAGWALRMLQMALYPLPHYDAESTMAWSTHLLLQGLSPWSLSQYPAALNAYGIGYPLLCAPFAWAFGCSLTVLRFVSLACLLGAAALVYAAARRLGLGAVTAFWAALACLASWSISYTPIAKSDGLVTLLFISGLFLSESFPSDSRRAALVGALGALAFFVKPYGILAVPWALAALAWRRRWREAVVLGFTFGAGFLALAVWIRANHPLYFEEVFLLNMNIAQRDFAHRWQQWKALGLFCGAVGAFALAALLWRPRSSFTSRLALPWVLPCLASLALFHFKLSLHSAAGLTYFFQMTWPCLILAGAALAKLHAWERGFLLPLVACTLILVGWDPGSPYLPFRSYRALDEQLTQELAPHKRPAGRGYAAMWLWPRGSVTLDYGQAEFARYGEDNHGWSWAFPSAPAMAAKRVRFEKGMASLISQGRFGVIAVGGQETTPIESSAMEWGRIYANAYMMTPQLPVGVRLSLIRPKRTP
jgi:hypothetical protein